MYKPFYLSIVLLLLLAARPARAHDILASTANFWVRPTGIDVELYMARAAGGLLIAKDGETISIQPETFPTFKDRLQAAGSGLLTVTPEGGTALKPDAVAVSLTDENDICFNLHYPLPNTMPSPLKIRAAYLGKMAEGHVGNLYVMNARGDDFGWGEVRPESPELNAKLPASADLPAPRTTPATQLSATAMAAPTPADPNFDSATATSAPPWIVWLTLATGTLFIAIVIIILRRSTPKKSPK